MNLYFKSLPFFIVFLFIYIFISLGFKGDFEKSCSVSYISQRVQLKQVKTLWGEGGVEDFNSKNFCLIPSPLLRPCHILSTPRS